MHSFAKCKLYKIEIIIGRQYLKYINYHDFKYKIN